jgi:hypothetical protein
MKEIYLKSTEAIGDAVISTGLVSPLHKAGHCPVTLITRPFICPLWENLPGTEAIPSDRVPKDELIVDISGYLGKQFEPENRGLHLTELQAVEIAYKGGTEINSSPDDVRLVLTRQELEEGARVIAEISQENGNLPVVAFAPRSTTKNRNIPTGTLQKVVTGLSGKVTSCVLQSPEEGVVIEGASTLWRQDLREFAAVLAAADSLVLVDSGPAHIVNGVLQGSGDTMNEVGLNPELGKVVYVLGSGPPSAVVYGSGDNINQVVTGKKDACDIHCRAYGYSVTKERLRDIFRNDFYPSERDNSFCKYPDFSTEETAECMKSVDPKAVIEAVKIATGSS